MDIKPPLKSKPKQPPKPKKLKLQPAQKKAPLQFVPEANTTEQPPGPKKRFSKKLIALIAAGVSLLAITAAAIWAFIQTTPLDVNGHGRRVNIEAGLAPGEIASILEQNGIIRSALAFRLYTSWQGVGSQLQAGTYVLSPEQSLQEVVNHVVEGKIDALRVTVLPGLTTSELTQELADGYGFKKSEVEEALKMTYDHPLLASKPAKASLEGYIYPETYEISGNAAPEELFKISFDELWERLQEDNLLKQIKKRGFTLHQAVILASIIQREVADPEEQKQVSQIFQKRLKQDMPLGADATFVYAAKQLGVEPRVNLDSPYNTRIYKGLTPGPISNFNLSAIQAVANPAKGDYLYFVSGDNGKTYYARTLEEHEANVATYCKELCSLF
jgi:UPF0755 protein